MTHTSKPQPRRRRRIVPTPGVTRHPRGGWRVVASAGTGADRRRLVRVHARPDLDEYDEHAGAVALLAELRAELDGSAAEASGESLAAVCRRYAERLVALGRAESYCREIARKVDELAESELGRKGAGDVTADELRLFYARQASAGLGRSTVMAWHKLFSAALAAAVERGELAVNVAAGPKVAPPAPQANGAAPSPELARRYLAAIEHDEPTLGVLLRIAGLTGARRGELCALRWLDVDLAGSTMTIEHGLTSPKGGGWRLGPTKSRKSRTIPLSEPAVVELTAHRARRESLCLLAGVELDESGFIFGPDEHPGGAVPFLPDYVSKRPGKIADAHGLPRRVCHPHGLRHYFATQGIAAGADVVNMAAVLGHGPRVTLDTYAHAVDEAKIATAAAVGQTLGR